MAPVRILLSKADLILFYTTLGCSCIPAPTFRHNFIRLWMEWRSPIVFWSFALSATLNTEFRSNFSRRRILLGVISFTHSFTWCSETPFSMISKASCNLETISLQLRNSIVVHSRGTSHRTDSKKLEKSMSLLSSYSKHFLSNRFIYSLNIY